MSKLRWEAKAAKRELAEHALRKGIEHIEAAQLTGGPTMVSSGRYTRALFLARHAVELLRQSEES